MEDVFKQLAKSIYYYICKLCIRTHGIKNDFIIQANNKKQWTKLYEQHQKSFLHSESIKWSYKKEEENDKEFMARPVQRMDEEGAMGRSSRARLVRCTVRLEQRSALPFSMHETW